MVFHKTGGILLQEEKMMISDEEFIRRNARLRQAVLLAREPVFGKYSIHIEYFIYFLEKNPARNDLHTHQFWELSCLVNGGMDYIIRPNGKMVSLTADDNNYVLIPPGWEHYRESQKKNALILGFMLSISGKTPEDDRRFLKRTEKLGCKLRGGSQSILRNLESSLTGKEQVLGTEEISLRIRLLLVSIFRENFEELFETPPLGNRYRNPVWLAEHHIAENLNLPLPVDELAALCKLSRRQFYRCFEAEYGMPVNKFILKRRLSFAAQQLMHTKSPVKEIVENAGFKNMSYFIRQFRQAYSMSPGEFRALGTEF